MQKQSFKLPSATRNPFEKGFLDFLKLLTIKSFSSVAVSEPYPREGLFQKGPDPPEANWPCNRLRAPPAYTKGTKETPINASSLIFLFSFR